MLVGLVASLVTGSLSGAVIVWKTARAKRTLWLCFDLEVKLAQLDGLIHTALLMSTEEPSASLLTNVYVPKYSFQISQLIQLVGGDVGGDHAAELIGASSLLGDLINQLQAPGVHAEEMRTLLTNMIPLTGQLRSTTRRIIYSVSPNG